jgi:uncharacterized membrane protein YcjF (UPF0283 family)
MGDLLVIFIKIFISIRLFYFSVQRTLQAFFEQDFTSLAYAIMAVIALFLLWTFDDIKQKLLG